MNKTERIADLIRRNPTCYNNSFEALKIWMDNTTSGTEEEAFKLIQFIETWKNTFRFNANNNREYREALLRSGITSQIEEHFIKLDLNRQSFHTSSIKLLAYGLYGPAGENTHKKTENKQNELINKDALDEHYSGDVDSVRNTAKKLDLDCKTIKGYREKPDHNHQTHLIKEVLKKSKI